MPEARLTRTRAWYPDGVRPWMPRDVVRDAQAWDIPSDDPDAERISVKVWAAMFAWDGIRP